jgi:hypothetical protein
VTRVALILLAAWSLACGPKELPSPKQPGDACDEGRCGEGLRCESRMKPTAYHSPGRCSLDEGRCYSDKDCRGVLDVCHHDAVEPGHCIEAPSGLPRK